MTPESPVRVCPQCGRSVLAEAVFCPHCGARSEPAPRRSPLAVLLDWLVTAFVLVLVLVFGLAGACFLLLGTSGGLRGIIPLAIGIVLLLAAGALIRHLRRRREQPRSGTPPAPPTEGM